MKAKLTLIDSDGKDVLSLDITVNNETVLTKNNDINYSEIKNGINSVEREEGKPDSLVLFMETLKIFNGLNRIGSVKLVLDDDYGYEAMDVDVEELYAILVYACRT